MPSTRGLSSLPKAHLHLHLEAGMRESTLVELAAQMGIGVPKLSDFTDFTQFDAAYQTLFAVPDNLARLIDEVVQDAATQGAVYVELGVVAEVHAPTRGRGAVLDQRRRSDPVRHRPARRIRALAHDDRAER